MTQKRPLGGLRAVPAAASAADLQALAPAPLYAQIKDVLRSRILDGTYQPHQQLPSESEMMVAFSVGQVAAQFVDTDFSNGAWPMVVPMLLAGCGLLAIAFLWLPRLQHPIKEKESP